MLGSRCRITRNTPFLVKCIRQISCKIVSFNVHPGDEDGGDGETGMALESHVRYVDAIVDGLRRPPVVAKFGVDSLMRCLLLSRRLRDRSKLAETVEKACQLLPALVRDLALRTLRDGFLQVPSPAHLQSRVPE